MQAFPADKPSFLASNMAQEASEMETFPVLIGDEIAYFHRIDGGYSTDDDCHIVSLIHEVQGIGSPYRVDPDQASHTVEAHLSDNFYNLDVRAVKLMDDYPDEDYGLSLKVDDYQYGEFSFNEAMSRSIDKRTQEIAYETQD